MTAAASPGQAQARRTRRATSSAAARWTAEEADAQIEKILAEHARSGAGFVWWVMPFDTPPISASDWSATD